MVFSSLLFIRIVNDNGKSKARNKLNCIWMYQQNNHFLFYNYSNIITYAELVSFIIKSIGYDIEKSNIDSHNVNTVFTLK